MDKPESSSDALAHSHKPPRRAQTVSQTAAAPGRTTVIAVGNGHLRKSLRDAGHTIVDHLDFLPIAKSRRRDILLRMGERSSLAGSRRGGDRTATHCDPTTDRTALSDVRVHVLCEDVLNFDKMLFDPVAALASRLSPGDIVLVEKVRASGDTARTCESIEKMRPDLLDDENGLLVDVAFAPQPVHRSPGHTPIVPHMDRFVGGVTPRASRRASEILRTVHDGPILTADAASIETLELPHTDADRGPRCTLSVIMPAFNAVDFIEESVRSVLAQKVDGLELVVVDDGSTDGTAEVIDALCQSDSRLVLFRSEHAGPGVARNTGVRHARGRYLAFADADDRVLPGAYNHLINSLETTGSEVATGAYVRIGPTGVVRPHLSEHIHDLNRTYASLAEAPQLLEEPVLWNKVYRRELWDRAVHAVPDVDNYEDQEPVFRALLAARGIDVHTRDVYGWRLPNRRITRSRGQHRRRNLRARATVISALELLIDGTDCRVRDHAYSTWVGRDLMMHAQKVPEARKKFFRFLSRTTRGLIRRMPDSAWDLVPAQERYLAHAVAQGSLVDVEEILGTRAEETASVPLNRRDGHWWCAPTYLGRLKNPIPPDLTRARTVDFTVHSGLRTLEWRSPGHAVVSGYAYIPGTDPRNASVELIGFIGESEVMRIDTTRTQDQRAAQDSNDPWNNVTPAGFLAAVRLPNVRRGQRISLRARVTVEGQSAVGHISMPLSVAPAPLLDEDQAPDIGTSTYRWVARRSNRNQVRFDAVERTRAEPVVQRFSVTADRIKAHLSKPVLGQLVAVSRDGDVEFHQEGTDATGAVYSAAYPPAPERLDDGGERFLSLVRRVKGQEDHRLAAAATLCRQVSPTALRFSSDSEGRARLAQRARRVTASSVRVGDNGRTLTINGRVDPPESRLRIEMRMSGRTLPATTTIDSSGTYTAVIPLVSTGSEESDVAVPSGGYFLRYELPNEADGWVRTSGSMVQHSHFHETHWSTVLIEERRTQALAVIVGAPLTAPERTKYWQFQIREQQWGPLENSVVFESFNGKASAGNSRALLNSLVEHDDSVTCWWSVRDRGTEVPKGARALVMGTAKWHRVMATARVWVNDNNFPYYVRKRPEQYYIQTWHGTPIKQLLWDLPRRKVPLSYRRLMTTEVRQWDVLIAQTTQAAKNLRSGLGHRGEILIGEYPRNQRLTAQPVTILDVRNRLGVDPVLPIILYAPTWREEDRVGSGFKWDEFLSVDRLRNEVPAQVLVRAHHVVTPTSRSNVEYIDVTDERHIEDLISIADLLITDYSSAAIDFRTTGKPVVFYAPDLKEYQRERGLYTKLPFITETDELLATVKQEISAPKRPSATELTTTMASATTQACRELILRQMHS